ncbi:MAG: ATP phosphoribosyltransferase regulatory subunit, partial [Clostridiales bacterium]|nr:ATP phosphoribosyltransferase regulatory subunit [Clostridiales bacterium]
MKNILAIPNGMKDYMPEECTFKKNIEDNVMRIISKYEYKQIETPIIEYMDLFCSAGAFDQEDMFKLSDDKGSALVLRPDMTIPAARLAATRYEDKDLLKLCYKGNVFHFNRDNTWEFKEVTQMGIEYMGESSTFADAEVINIAYECTKKAGLKNIQIDLGQVDFYYGLMQEAGINETNANKLSMFVEQKDTLATELLLQQLKVDGASKNLLMNLPSLFGGIEALEKAYQYTANKRCRKAVENLSDIINLLNDDVKGSISIDFSMVQSIHYYTGMIFKGISNNLGTPILTGGRYDNLTASFGKIMPATGFALDGSALLSALYGRSDV